MVPQKPTNFTVNFTLKGKIKVGIRFQYVKLGLGKEMANIDNLKFLVKFR